MSQKIFFSFIISVINIGTSAQLAVQLPKTFDFVSMKSIPTAVQLYPHFGNSQLAVAASLNGIV